ncbi:cytochrome C assembly family protein [Thiobacillus sedimenti]|uniref:Cytochrome c biogenesis protein CcsA n=1 Tax=Thiobacillus sedimenti TaxID=3110231 RepID=A0ABZ1CHH6_9PROT|nr:cytochrome c biogenesis protein CcsA [Thiobacillus sp. SCUT-2]WRS38836.1 cytochrome c biogenesis protein CcsA [Thiobacillus sp. SCUT-2]
MSALYGWIAWRLQRAPSSASVRLLTPLALLAHGALIFNSVLGQGDIRLGFGNSLSTILWLTAVTYWLASQGAPLARLQSWVSGLAGVSVLGMAFLTETHPIPDSQALVLRAHLVVSFLAYGLLAVAALHAVMMTMLEKQLHRGAFLQSGTPPLLTLEAMLFRTIGVGFALLTLAVFSGVFFSEELFGTPLQFSHKIVFGVLSWLVFGGLLLGRHFRGWRGRTALYWTITGFTLLLLAYLGTQFVLEIILRR